MAKYKITVTKTAEKVLSRLPKEIAPKVVSAIQSLADNPYPSGCRKLSGHENIFRVRVQNYRIIYEVLKNVIEIIILKIGHRKDVYR